MGHIMEPSICKDMLAEISCSEFRTLCESKEACQEIEKCCPFHQSEKHTTKISGNVYKHQGYDSQNIITRLPNKKNITVVQEYHKNNNNITSNIGGMKGEIYENK